MTINPYIVGSIIPMAIAIPVSPPGTAQNQEERVVIGKTYPIIEPDALAEIEARVARKPFDPKVFGEEESWSALNSPTLPVASRREIRRVIPFFALSFDIPDKDGNILYPAGYTFNPLEYLRLPSRLIIVNNDQLDWAFAQAEIGDMVIMAGGNALQAMRDRGVPVFKLEEQVRDRLDLRFVPSIVEQDGTVFVIEEILLDGETEGGADG